MPLDSESALLEEDSSSSGGFSELRMFAPIATAHFFSHVMHTSCIADHEGKHDTKGTNVFHKNGT